jgi:hypothetical protein
MSDFRHFVGKPRKDGEDALSAEIERLHTQLAFRTEVSDRLAVCNAEAAAFLDRMADRIEHMPIYGEQAEHWAKAEAAADCRAMAKKLRGET